MQLAVCSLSLRGLQYSRAGHTGRQSHSFDSVCIAVCILLLAKQWPYSTAVQVAALTRSDIVRHGQRQLCGMVAFCTTRVSSSHRLGLRWISIAALVLQAL